MKASKIRRMETENAKLRTALARTKRQLTLIQASADKRDEMSKERMFNLEESLKSSQMKCASLEAQMKTSSDTRRTQRGRVLFVSKERLASNESISRHNGSSRPQTAPSNTPHVMSSRSVLPTSIFVPDQHDKKLVIFDEKEEKKAKQKTNNTSMPRIVQKSNSSSSSSPTRSRVIVVNTPSESKTEMRSSSETKGDVRNVRRIIPSSRKNKSKKSTMNQVDRLLKGMSAEMKNGIREDEAAIAARKSRQKAKTQGAVSTDSVVDEKKRKKKVSIVVRAAYSLTSLSYITLSLTHSQKPQVPGKNISKEDNTSSSPTSQATSKKSVVPINKVKAKTSSSTKQTSSKSSGRKSPSPSPTNRIHRNKSSSKMSKRKLNQEKKIIRAELEKEYRTKLREAKKIMACAKVEKNLRISVVAPSVSLYFGNKRVNSKGPYPVEKARNLIREKVLPEFTHLYELQNKKVQSPSGTDMELWLEDCVREIYGSIETHLQGVLDLKRESKRVQFDW